MILEELILKVKKVRDRIEREKDIARLATKDDYNEGYLKALENITAIFDEHLTIK